VVAGVARTEKVYVRENVCMGNCAEAAGLLDHAECHCGEWFLTRCRLC
jgi:hypothetical protein